MNMIKEFTIGASHTINLGNYESLKIEASITVTPNEGEITEQEKTEAQSDLRALLVATYNDQRRKDNDEYASSPGRRSR
jgi:hypothetical protein